MFMETTGHLQNYVITSSWLLVIPSSRAPHDPGSLTSSLSLQARPSWLQLQSSWLFPDGFLNVDRPNGLILIDSSSGKCGTLWL